MKKPNYTPGPWTVEVGADNLGQKEFVYGSIVSPDPLGLHVCRIWSDTREAKDNAQLIAAAPSLAEALHSLMEVAKLYSAFGFLAEIEAEVEEARKALELAGWYV